jgi:hypothetical protein
MRHEPDHAGPGRLGPDRLRLGYDVDENAIRFSNYLHLLRELVHLSAGWLALAPEFEIKYATTLERSARSAGGSTSCATRAITPAPPARSWPSYSTTSIRRRTRPATSNWPMELRSRR